MTTKTSAAPRKPMPIVMARAKFMQKLTEEVNQSGLPAFVMRDVVKDLLQALEQAAAQETQAALAEYNNGQHIKSPGKAPAPVPKDAGAQEAAGGESGAATAGEEE